MEAIQVRQLVWVLPIVFGGAGFLILAFAVFILALRNKFSDLKAESNSVFEILSASFALMMIAGAVVGLVAK